MKYYEFNYSKKFNCIADKCKHNCCIGWDIAVDKRSRDKYKSLEVLDNRFLDQIENNCFKLTTNARCPFLDEDNLCHVIKNYGEKSLCKTCKTHPRFKNFFKGVTETGLGLYCEEAGRIILSSKEKMKIVLVKDDNKPSTLTSFEKKVLAFRNKVMKILQNRKLTISDRLFALQPLCQVNLDKKDFSSWIALFSSLEKLEINDYSFDKIKGNSFCTVNQNFDLAFEQLLCYLAYRHLSRAIDILDLKIRLAFVVLSFNVINTIFSQGEKSLENLIEIVRFYSSEIECNDDNLYEILNEIENLVSFI